MLGYEDRIAGDPQSIGHLRSRDMLEDHQAKRLEGLRRDFPPDLFETPHEDRLPPLLFPGHLRLGGVGDRRPKRRLILPTRDLYFLTGDLSPGQQNLSVGYAEQVLSQPAPAPLVGVFSVGYASPFRRKASSIARA